MRNREQNTSQAHPGPFVNHHFSPDFLSIQVVSGSEIFGNAFYLGIGIATILPKMVPPKLTFGERAVEFQACSRITYPSVFILFLLE